MYKNARREEIDNNQLDLNPEDLKREENFLRDPRLIDL